MLSWSVVCAVGNSIPRWPEWTAPWRARREHGAAPADESTTAATDRPLPQPQPLAQQPDLVLPPHALLHSSELIGRCFSGEPSADKSPAAAAASPDVSLQLPSSPVVGRLLVVGGGLTGAQLACAVLAATGSGPGSSPPCWLSAGGRSPPQHRTAWTVDWCIRGYSRVKAFDVDTEWVSPSTANMCMAHFHRLAAAADADTGGGAGDSDSAIDAKLRAIRAARQGGSMTQEAAKAVDEWRAAGRLVQREHTQVQSIEWITIGKQSGHWRVQLSRTRPGAKDVSATDSSGQQHPPVVETLDCDAIWLCTGSVPDVRQHGFLRELAATHRVHAASGLPVVDDHLAWAAIEKEKECGSADLEQKQELQQAGPDSAAANGGASEPPQSPTTAPIASLPPPAASPSRFHFVGGLGCVHLGPDAFNLRGAQAASRNIFTVLRRYIEETDRAQKAEGRQLQAQTATASPMPTTTSAPAPAPALASTLTVAATLAGPAASGASAVSVTSERPIAFVPQRSASLSASAAAAPSRRPSDSSRSRAPGSVSAPVCTPSSRRNQLTRGAKCLECNLAAGDATQQRTRLRGKGNPFQCLDQLSDEHSDDEQEDEEKKEKEDEEKVKMPEWLRSDALVNA